MNSNMNSNSINSTNKKAQTIEDIIEASPSNRFSMEIIIIVALTWFLPGTQAVLISNISPYVQCEFALRDSSMAFSTSFFYIGLFVGAMFFGYVGDACGRKFATLCGSFLLLYFGMLSGAATSIVFLTATRFMVGVGIADVFINGCALVTEYVKVNQRATGLFIFFLVNVAGTSFGYLMSYFILNKHGWRMLSVVVCLPNIPFMIAMSRVPESYKYFQLTNNREKLIQIIQQICNLNKVEVPHAISVECKASPHQASYVSILKHHGVKSFLLFWLWLAGIFCYYGQTFLITYRLQNHHSCTPGELAKTSIGSILLNFSTSHLKANITAVTTNQYPSHCQMIQDSDHLISFTISLAPLLSSLLMVPLARIRRKSLILFIFLVQCFTYALQMVCMSYWLNLVILMLSFCTACLLGSILYLYSLELYPTVIRTTATGLVSSIAKLFLVITPLLFQYLIYKSIASVAWFMLGLIGVAIVCVIFLEETHGKPLARE